MNWRTIRLELASYRDFPAGSVSRGFLLRLPLIDGRVTDEPALGRSPHRATVRRFWSAEPDENGKVLCGRGQLVLRCPGRPDRLLQTLTFEVGDRVFVTDRDGACLPFRVASIGNVG